ncbi:hypothetical protein [Morganella morganii]|uniref:primase 1D-like protein n=1 Tax=Morganella morganii TaxID=582 RepID=UPI001BDADBCF|nr:hypothetical protein [Morganella morganii]ELA8730200.1 hypothetical protein [Morganella morganii]ELB1850170.1 hypothetical protein [Morganella morganii]MBT0489245.1 hypothetical protein [Morganella morganii subsp. morganii]MBT0492633.1 hypothetical protein [Morganella morganii subsp. morganii]QWL91920.1 hypothetical protein IZ186_11410 [Morganella morganii subsp. morganii]
MDLINKNQRINRHPFIWVRELLYYNINYQHISNDPILTLSKYRYSPQSFSDYRNVFSLPLTQLDEFTLFNIIMELNEGEELAFHSKIECLGFEYHIPLIDFGNVDRGIIDSLQLRELCHHWNIQFRIFDSGRSYHAYGNKLINNNDWVQFMGSLLLLNKPSGFKLIDERWIGHRIMAGYSALRWSNNSSFYKKTPIYIGYMNSDGIFLDKDGGRNIYI